MISEKPEKDSSLQPAGGIFIERYKNNILNSERLVLKASTHVGGNQLNRATNKNTNLPLEMLHRSVK